MKIVISSTGETLESKVDSRFGRCPFFIVAVAEGNEIKSFDAVKNPATAMAGGAGISAAEMVANMKPDAVLTGNMGPKAMQVISEFGIKAFQASGTVRQAISDYLAGNLSQQSEPSPGYFGMGSGKRFQ